MTNATSPPPSLECPPTWSTSNTIDDAGTRDEVHSHRREVAELPLGWTVEGGQEALEPVEVGVYAWHHAERRDGDPSPGVALSVPADSFGVRYLSASDARSLAHALQVAAHLLDGNGARS